MVVNIFTKKEVLTEGIMQEKGKNMSNEKIKYYGRVVVGGTLFGVLVYFSMMSLDLVNSYDGIWHWSNFIAGDWEISLGRGLQRYFDKLRFGIVSTSLNTVLTQAIRHI